MDAASEDPPFDYDDPDLQFTSPILGGPPDGQSDATPQVDRSRSADTGKRQRLSVEEHGRGDSILSGSTIQQQQQTTDVSKEDDSLGRRNPNAEAELELELRQNTLDRREACIAAREERTEARHQAALAVQREVGLANAASSMATAESVKSVADALLKLVAAQLQSRDS